MRVAVAIRPQLHRSRQNPSSVGSRATTEQGKQESLDFSKDDNAYSVNEEKSEEKDNKKTYVTDNVTNKNEGSQKRWSDK